MKKILSYLILVLVIILNTGCVEKKGKNDIKDYIKEKYNLKDITVSNKCEQENGLDNYTDCIWTVTDNTSNTNFHVRDDHYWSNEMLNNRLDDDYCETMFLNNKKVLETNNINLVKENENSKTNNGNIVCNYHNKNEITECINSLKKINDYFKTRVKDFSLLVILKHKVIINNNIDVSSKFDTARRIDRVDVDLYDLALNEYYLDGLRYQIDEIKNEMTNEEYKKIMNDPETCRVYVKGKYGSAIKYYDNIVGISAYKLSISSLYYLLQMEGFNVTGNKNHYKVKGLNGDIYEISYDFNDMIYPDNEVGNYYLKNGQKEEMQYRNLFSFSDNAINNMFGLNIAINYNKYIGKY